MAKYYESVGRRLQPFERKQRENARRARRPLGGARSVEPVRSTLGEAWEMTLYTGVDQRWVIPEARGGALLYPSNGVTVRFQETFVRAVACTFAETCGEPVTRLVLGVTLHGKLPRFRPRMSPLVTAPGECAAPCVLLPLCETHCIRVLSQFFYAERHAFAEWLLLLANHNVPRARQWPTGPRTPTPTSATSYAVLLRGSNEPVMGERLQEQLAKPPDSGDTFQFGHEERAARLALMQMCAAQGFTITVTNQTNSIWAGPPAAAAPPVATGGVTTPLSPAITLNAPFGTGAPPAAPTPNVVLPGSTSHYVMTPGGHMQEIVYDQERGAWTSLFYTARSGRVWVMHLHPSERAVIKPLLAEPQLVTEE